MFAARRGLMATPVTHQSNRGLYPAVSFAGIILVIIGLAAGVTGTLLSLWTAETARVEHSKLDETVEALELRIQHIERQVETLGFLFEEVQRSSSGLTRGEGRPTETGILHKEVVLPKTSSPPSPTIDPGAIPEWIREKYPRSLRGLLATLDVSDSQTLGFSFLSPMRDVSEITQEERLLATEYLSLHWEELADRDVFTQGAVLQGTFVEVFETREEASQAQKSRMSSEVHQTADGRFGLIDVEALLREDPLTTARRERMRTIQELLGVKVCSVGMFTRE